MRRPVEDRGRLFVMATPLGNLGDITLRALEVLKKVDVVFSESLRKSRVLLGHLGIKKRVVVLNVKNERRRVKDLLTFLRMGKDVALITDSGTPGISDPGYLPVRCAVDGGFQVVPVPGPSSLTAFVSVSGLPSERFVFEGFLPKSKKRRRDRLSELLSMDYTFFFFESPARIVGTLDILSELSPERKVALGRELTKVHEEIIRGTAREVFDILSKRNKVQGEFVVGVAKEGV